MERREFSQTLISSGILLGGFAGCLQLAPTDSVPETTRSDSGTTTTNDTGESTERETEMKDSTSKSVRTTRTQQTSVDETKSTVPPCKELYDPDFSFKEEEIKYHSCNGFVLTVTPKTVELGDKITVTLQNTTTQNQETGNKQKYDIQYKSDNGWRSIFKLYHRGWSEQAIIHRPNDGFVWKQRFSAEGLSQKHKYNPSYHVCSELQPGEYRFLYWGLINSEECSVLAAKFTVKDST